jgi:hypothetical protein
MTEFRHRIALIYVEIDGEEVYHPMRVKKSGEPKLAALRLLPEFRQPVYAIRTWP